MKTVHPVTGQLEPDPLDPSQIVSGNPETSDLILAESEDGTEVAGLWRCTPGVSTDTEVEESFLVITGKATIEFEDGSSIEVGPGDTHRFNGGEKTTWTVEETLLKAFWLQSQAVPASERPLGA